MNQQSTKITKTVILGGGSAGWLTALFVNKLYPTWEITVVEDPTKPPIIAGESGTTTFTSFLSYLKIDIEDFIRKTNSTPKLGGRLKNWTREGSEFYHVLVTDHAPWYEDFLQHVDEMPPIGISLGASIKEMYRHKEKDLYEAGCIAADIPLAEAFYAYYFIKENKVPVGSTNSHIPIHPMWHFESRAAAEYFKITALDRGIKLIQGKYTHSTQLPSGDIKEIILDQHTKISADLFFDCSGFSRLLLGQALNEPLIDYTNYFPARSVVAWWDKPCACVTTNANAMKYGWSWNINLQHRSGNGYIFDPDLISMDQAVEEAEKFYGYKIDPIANFTFVPGMVKNAWKNNVIGIGLSTGFLEPLEANGIQVIIEQLWAFQDLYRPGDKNPQRPERFNQRVSALTDDVLDFLALHYRGHRRDTDFWKSHAYDKFRVPASLEHKLQQWQEYFRGDIAQKHRAGGYSATAWLQVIQGLELFDTKSLAQQMQSLRGPAKQSIKNNSDKYRAHVKNYPSISEWLTTHK